MKKTISLRKFRLACLTLMITMMISIPVSAIGSYTINGKTIKYTDFASSPGECWDYANKIYNKIWGQNFSSTFNDNNNMLRNLSDSQLTLTQGHLKEYVSKANLGSAIRICNSVNLHSHDGYISGNPGHVQIIVQKDANGFAVVEGGLTAAPHCREKYYTWSEFCTTSWLGGQYGYIKYIKWPGAPAFSTTHDPTGCVDSATASTGKITVRGWAFDVDVPKTSIGVHVYVGGPAGSAGAEGHAITANKSRPDVARAYASSNIGNYHGFDDTFTTKKTGTQTLYFYAINAGGGTNNPQIGTKTVNIPKDTTKPTISNVKVTNVSSKGYTVTCNVSDNVGVTQVKFPTWTAFSAAASEQDDLKWHVGTISNGKATYTVKTSEHNNEVDINYVTHIYAYDAAGNTTSYSLAGRYIPGFSEAEKKAFKPVVSEVIGKSRYEVYDKSLTWSDAKAFCESKGGHLVVITSASENNSVLNLIRKGQKKYYAIGAESVNSQGVWRWVNKEAFSYQNWDLQGIEGNTSGEPYAYMVSVDNAPNKQSGEWFDNPNRCVLNNYYHYKNSGFVCEYKIEIKKKANPLTLKVTKKTYKKAKLTKKKTFNIGATKAQGKVTYTLNSAAIKAKITVSSAGKVTIPAKCKKGTYKITVKADGNSKYNSGSKTVTIVIK